MTIFFCEFGLVIFRCGWYYNQLKFKCDREIFLTAITLPKGSLRVEIIECQTQTSLYDEQYTWDDNEDVGKFDGVLLVEDNFEYEGICCKANMQYLIKVEQNQLFTKKYKSKLCKNVYVDGYNFTFTKPNEESMCLISSLMFA